jgi:hypothetical protein
MSAAAIAALPIVARRSVLKLLRQKFGVNVAPKPRAYVWKRSDVLGLAHTDCIRCHGLGLADGRMSSQLPCGCAARRIFREIMAEWRRNQEAVHISKFQPEQVLQRGGKTCRRAGWSMKRPEYVAEVELLAKRTLSYDEWLVWRAYHCRGLEWREACATLGGMNKGELYHCVYRVEAKMGRAAREVQPYALYPIAEYYGL